MLLYLFINREGYILNVGVVDVYIIVVVVDVVVVVVNVFVVIIVVFLCCCACLSTGKVIS